MDTENGLPTGSGGLFGSGVMSDSVAFLGGGEAAAPVEAAPAEASPAEEAPVKAAADESERDTPPVNDAVEEVLPKRGGPSPVLREYLKSQEERVRRAEAAVEAQRQENLKLVELAQSLMAGKAAPAAEEELEEEPLDPLERDLKATRAKVDALERANQEREQRVAQVRMHRAHEAAKNEIVSEVDHRAQLGRGSNPRKRREGVARSGDRSAVRASARACAGGRQACGGCARVRPSQTIHAGQ